MKSVTRIKNTDDLCMAQNLVVGKAVAEEEDNWYGRLIRAEEPLTWRTEKLIKDAPLKERELKLEEVSALERASKKRINSTVARVSDWFLSGSFGVSSGCGFGRAFVFRCSFGCSKW